MVILQAWKWLLRTDLKALVFSFLFGYNNANKFQKDKKDWKILHYAAKSDQHIKVLAFPFSGLSLKEIDSENFDHACVTCKIILHAITIPCCISHKVLTFNV